MHLLHITATSQKVRQMQATWARPKGSTAPQKCLVCEGPHMLKSLFLPSAPCVIPKAIRYSRRPKVLANGSPWWATMLGGAMAHRNGLRCPCPCTNFREVAIAVGKESSLLPLLFPSSILLFFISWVHMILRQTKRSACYCVGLPLHDTAKKTHLWPD